MRTNLKIFLIISIILGYGSFEAMADSLLLTIGDEEIRSICLNSYHPNRDLLDLATEWKEMCLHEQLSQNAENQNTCIIPVFACGGQFCPNLKSKESVSKAKADAIESAYLQARQNCELIGGQPEEDEDDLYENTDDDRDHDSFNTFLRPRGEPGMLKLWDRVGTIYVYKKIFCRVISSESSPR